MGPMKGLCSPQAVPLRPFQHVGRHQPQHRLNSPICRVRAIASPEHVPVKQCYGEIGNTCRGRCLCRVKSSGVDNAEPSDRLDPAWDGRHTEVHAVRRAAAMWRIVDPIESLEQRLNTCAMLLPDLPSNIWRMDPTHVARLAAASDCLADRLIYLKDTFPSCDVERMVVMSRLKIALEEKNTIEKIVAMYKERLPMFETDILHRIMEAMPSLLNLEDQLYMAAPQQEAAQLLTMCGSKAEPWVGAIFIAKHQITEELAPCATATGSPVGMQRLGRRIGQLGTY